jgi:hypothetical protein
MQSHDPNVIVAAVFRNITVTCQELSDKHKQPSGSVAAGLNIPASSRTHGSLLTAPPCKKSSDLLVGSSDGTHQASLQPLKSGAHTWQMAFKALGVHQAQNVAAAMTALQLLRTRIPLPGTNEDALSAMAQVRTLCKSDLYSVDRAGQSAFASHPVAAACDVVCMAL